MWLSRHHRLSQLDLTFGLRYVGVVGNDRRVFSNLKVVERRPDEVIFEGGAAARADSVESGRVRGRVVTTWVDTRGKPHFQSISY
jgi:hypothetical protein